MTKILAKMPCDKPDCTHPHEMEIEYSEPKIPKATTTVMAGETPQTTVLVQEQRHEHTETKKDPHDELAEMLPKGVNFGKCANGNCGKKIKNAKGLTTKYKSCPNCRANTVPKNNDYCPTCGKEPEEWDDSEVELETGEEE